VGHSPKISLHDRHEISPLRANSLVPHSKFESGAPNTVKLLHVIGSMDPCGGGPCQFIRNLAPWFAGPDHNMEVVCLDDPKSAYLSNEPLPVHALGTGRGSWNYHPSLLSWFQEHLPRFDAVFLNGLWQYPGLALSKVARSRSGPGYYVIPHGMLDPWFQRPAVRPWKALRNWIYWKAIEHRVVSQAKGLLFTCGEERRLARLPFRPYVPRRELVVGLGLPEPPPRQPRMQTVFEKKCPACAGQRYFLFLGRIHPKKAIDLLIKAYAALCQSQTSASRLAVPRLVIAGPDGETAYGQSMQSLGAEICPAGSIVWPGMLTGDAKWGALYNCEAFVLPSHQENFGIAVVEALACARPVMISNQVNIWREIAEQGAALVETDDLPGTTRLFQNWLNLSPAATASMAARARRCFQGCFSGELAARNLWSVVSASANVAATTRERINQL
jgi:glycosyltransferase involved in cell wall biosynthesis